MKECTVLMTGCGAPGAPGIIRCLRKNGERDIRIVAVDRNENAGARDLVDAFYTVPSAEKEDFLPAVLDICRRESVQVVIPIVTRELMKFARARAEFEALGAKVSVMEPDKLEIVNNKAHLLDAMRAHGLRTPEYRRVHTVEKLKAEVEGDEKTGVQIIARALTAPVKQIAANAGIDGSVVLEKIRESGKTGYGFDAYNEVYCDMIPAGIVDPTKVNRSALENAASIASTLLTTEALVADKPEPPAPAAPAAPDMGGMY